MRIIKTDPPVPDGYSIGALCNFCGKGSDRFVWVETHDQQICIICDKCVFDLGVALIEKYQLGDSQAGPSIPAWPT